MILSPYDPAWPVEFAALRDVYAHALRGEIIAIEHVGSTAVPGLPAKPVIDIDLVMPGYHVFPAVAAALEKLGYEHAGDQGIFQREVFKPRRGLNSPATTPARAWMRHHLYVCPITGRELARHLRFRDALRSSSALRTEYAKIKAEIAARSANDRKTYARLKETACRDFVERALLDRSSDSIRATTMQRE